MLKKCVNAWKSEHKQDDRQRKALLSLSYASLSDKFIIIDLYDSQFVLTVVVKYFDKISHNSSWNVTMKLHVLR